MHESDASLAGCCSATEAQQAFGMGPPVLRRLLNLPPVRSAASTHLFVLAVRAHYQHLIRYWSRERNAIEHNGYWVCCHGNVWTVRPPLNWPSVMRETNTNTLKCQKTVAAPTSHPQQLHFVHHEDDWRWPGTLKGMNAPAVTPSRATASCRKLRSAASMAARVNWQPKRWYSAEDYLKLMEYY